MQSGPCELKLLMVIFFICYCIFGVYFVTGTKNPDISEEGTFRISKLIFYITARGTLKDGQTQFFGPFHWTHIACIVSQAAWQCPPSPS
jgi:hypothetical protein